MFLKKLKIELPYDPVIALLGIYPKDTNVVIRRGICTRMFIAAMSTIAHYGKNLDIHQQMNGKEDVVYIHNGILCSHQKK